MAQTHQLSRDAYERLRAEHEDLTTRGRIEIARKIEVAREMGDLSENGDYHAAKDEQGKMEGRIAQLGGILTNAIVVDDEAVTTHAVGLGNLVGIRYAGADDVEYFLIGSIEERREGVDVISPTSPLGESLLGAEAGETVSYQAPGGNLQVTVVEIKA